ncbi:MAG: hypothetical protein CFE21_03660 [Bacteroidetes bacterium B1(2017)]|nr:MAG: hypothetical protein CFE21_03660 [Bacteroidetes bacterium B1(2017)]
MPIIIDTNCFANVFSRNSTKHNEFEPVLKWIIEGKGLIIYGGSKYKEELKRASKYLTLFRLLKEVGKVVNTLDTEIDKLQSNIERIKKEEAFNDVHLLAISVITKCRVICSEDTTSIQFVTSREYLPKGSVKPVYYTSKKNLNLLCDKYVDKSLKPLCKINKVLANRIYEKLPI